jgi:putative oxidoreductase
MRAYENWAPVVARVIFGLQFLLAASFKIPGTIGYQAESAYAGAAGLPFAGFFVGVAFLLEVLAGVSLILGWQVRRMAFLLSGYVLLIALLFYRNVADPAMLGQFVSHLGLIAGLTYVAVYGAQHFALSKDPGKH